MGDILGTGVYALTGDVAAEVGGAAWAPFIVAFVVAMITAFSYLELVTKYPQAAGAALYAHKAFGIHFLTFIIAFTVMCSGITSASTASRAFASNFAKGFKLDDKNTLLIVGIALAFMLLIALVNFRGVGESVKANIVLTMVELPACSSSSSWASGRSSAARETSRGPWSSTRPATRARSSR